MEARCPHVGRCGGCLFQHVSYSDQLARKQQNVQELFSPLLDAKSQVLPSIGADPIWFYRNKMEFSFSQDAAGRHFLGLYSVRNKRHIENISSCSIGPEWTNEALSRIHTFWQQSGLSAYHPYKNTGSLRTVAFRASRRCPENMVVLTVSGCPEFALSKQQRRDFVEAILPLEDMYQASFSCVLRIQQALEGHPTQWYDMVLHGQGVLHERYELGPFGEMTLQFSPPSFAQPNSMQAEKIYQTALGMLDLRPEDVLWDLFCGVGGFGLAAAPFVKKVVGVELSFDSAYDATCNRARMQRDNVIIERQDVFCMVSSEETMDRVGRPTKLVIDPPRVGCGPKVVDLLDRLSLEAIVYVSCNPVSQAKDVALFRAKGWRVDLMQAIDQFPHTPHLENIVLLKKVVT